MGVTSTRVGGARAATGVRATTIGIGSQDHEMTRRTDIVATGRNGLETGARIPETDATDIESASEGAQVPTAKMQGAHGENHRTHHYHIALVLPSHRLYSPMIRSSWFKKTSMFVGTGSVAVSVL